MKAVNLTGYTDYRKFLRNELKHRKFSNPKYSLRAFARDLGVSPQVLSMVMNGKKSFSSASAIAVARRLGLSQADASYFHDIVELSHAKTEELKEIIQFRIQRHSETDSYHTLQSDLFKTISDWFHYAILELTTTRQSRNDPAWISDRLGVPPAEIRGALKRLEDLGLLTVQGNKLRKTDLNLATTHDIPSEAVRKFTLQLLEKAAQAVEQQSIDERDFGTMTMSIDPAKLPEAKKRIQKFRRELARFLESGDRIEVYTFSSQLFRLSKPIIKVSRA